MNLSILNTLFLLFCLTKSSILQVFVSFLQLHLVTFSVLNIFFFFFSFLLYCTLISIQFQKVCKILENFNEKRMEQLNIRRWWNGAKYCLTTKLLWNKKEREKKTEIASFKPTWPRFFVLKFISVFHQTFQLKNKNIFFFFIKYNLQGSQVQICFFFFSFNFNTLGPKLATCSPLEEWWAVIFTLLW